MAQLAMAVGEFDDEGIANEPSLSAVGGGEHGLRVDHVELIQKTLRELKSFGQSLVVRMRHRSVFQKILKHK